MKEEWDTLVFYMSSQVSHCYQFGSNSKQAFKELSYNSSIL